MPRHISREPRSTTCATAPWLNASVNRIPLFISVSPWYQNYQAKRLQIYGDLRHLFSGLLTCGQCGGGFTLVGKAYYGCTNARNKGTCDNRLTIVNTDLGTRVLAGLKDQRLHPDLIAKFTRAYQEEFNRLAGSVKKDRAKAERVRDPAHRRRW
ncbi:zinc ribbon domain-containing protein [uncultured Sulfitobacter sp.]|uniref:zinc ribbon domain-containing protein n=1 Tax=uncultured Sulfitobacter sp. TaxID=191468 RepID=UPI0030F574EE